MPAVSAPGFDHASTNPHHEVVVSAEVALGDPFKLEEEDVPALLKLFRDVLRFFLPNRGVRDVHDDQSLSRLRMSHCEGPGYNGSPVVTHNYRLLLPEGFDETHNVFYQYVEPVILYTLGFITLVVASHVWGYNPEVLRHNGYLMPPGIPELWETVQEYHQLTLTLNNAVKTNPVGFNKSVLPLLTHIRLASSM